MHSKVKQRLVGALVLIGLVIIFVPIIFHSGTNMHADTIALTPVAPAPPPKLEVKHLVASEAKKLADKQQIIFEQSP